MVFYGARSEPSRLSPHPAADARDASEIFARKKVSKSCGCKQRSHALRLIVSVFERKQTAGIQMARRTRND